MRIYLVRHGQSEANLTRTIQGTLDSPLTELGKEQARTLNGFLPDRFDRVYMSDLSRARETGFLATGLSESSELIKTDPRLSEIHFGTLQGQPYSDFPAEHPSVREHVEFQSDALMGKFGAELVSAFLDRTHSVFEDIVSEMAEEDLSTVLVFTHGGVLRSIAQHYLKVSSAKWLNCEYGVLERSNGSWKLERFSDHIID